MESSPGSVSTERPPNASSQQPQSRSDVDSILKRKRKIREHKACYPCRTRKVKCDSNIPCKTCIDRNHPEICSWHPPSENNNKRVDTGSTHANGTSDDIADGAVPVTIGRDEWDRLCGKLGAMEKTIVELKQDLQRAGGLTDAGSADGASESSPRIIKRPELPAPTYLRAMEISEQSRLTGETVHLGGGSVPALIMALKQGDRSRPAVQEVFGSSVLPLFGLDNESATYPFVSLWGQPQGAAARVDELCKALPSDSECLESFRQYRDGAYVTYPAVAEIDKFESDLLYFLMNRRAPNATAPSYGNAKDLVHGMGLQWIGLLFAMFASGAQFSTLPRKDRDLISQVYVCCSFECLRLVNYLSNTSLEVIQTLLVLGNVLSNAMNAGAAWSLLGLTIRLAQSLGLHRSSEGPGSYPQQVLRNKIWWAILWQDSLLSVSYDRASSATNFDPLPPSDGAERGGVSYRESMYRVCKVGLDVVRNRVAYQSIESRLSRCGELRDEVQAAQDQASDHLRDFRSCRSIKDQSEYWLLYLHSSYMKSELCRPAISPSTAEFDKSSQLRRLCIENLLNTLDAFLGLHNVSPIHTRSWSVTHRALSSSLLLGILGEPQRNERAQELISALIDIFKGPNVDPSEVSAPVARSVSAMHKLCAPESRTPRAFDESVTSGEVKADVEASMQYSDNGLDVNLDDSYFLPSPLSGFENDSSPYALMDSIIWGNGNGMGPFERHSI